MSQLVKADNVVLWLEIRSLNFVAKVMDVGNLRIASFDWQIIAAAVE